MQYPVVLQVEEDNWQWLQTTAQQRQISVEQLLTELISAAAAQG